MRLPAVDVAVCIVQSGDGRVLLAQRTQSQVAPGFWELPGGKIDPGEAPANAAARELLEETGLRAGALTPWAAYEHVFPTKRVRLNFFRVERWSGTPQGREGQALAWIDPARPSVDPILPSNGRVLAGLGLPPICYFPEPRGRATVQSALDELPSVLAAGARLVVLREPEMAPDQRVAFVRRAVEIARGFDGIVMLAGSALEARRSGAAGVFSTAHELGRIAARPSARLWAAACAGADDLQRAADLGADFAFLSPVLSGDSPAGGRPIGWTGLQTIVAGARLPVYAHGGMSAAMAAQARQAGAAGVAVGTSELELR